jgi:hypothetical protein
MPARKKQPDRGQTGIEVRHAEKLRVAQRRAMRLHAGLQSLRLECA